MSSSYKSIISTTILALILLCLPIALSQMFDQSTIDRFVSAYTPQTLNEIVFFLIVFSLLGTLGLPRQVTAFTFGYLFGVISGTITATIIASIALSLTYLLSRFFCRPMVKSRFPVALTKIQHFFEHDIFLKAVIIRLIPAGSNFFTNVLAGSAKAPFLLYLSGSALGFIPQMALFCLLGAGIRVGDDTQLIITIGLILTSGALIGYLIKKTGYRLPIIRK
ncbi:TVP38/TMEM64 family protein [Thalassotalea ganghwensis]